MFEFRSGEVIILSHVQVIDTVFPNSQYFMVRFSGGLMKEYPAVERQELIITMVKHLNPNRYSIDLRDKEIGNRRTLGMPRK